MRDEEEKQNGLQNGNLNPTSEYGEGLRLADGETIRHDFIQGGRSVNSTGRRPEAELEENSDYGITERNRDFTLRLSP